MLPLQEDSRGACSSGVLKLTINVKGQENVVVKRETAKGNQVIDVGGATFFRRGKRSSQPPQPTPCKRGVAAAGSADENAAPPADVASAGASAVASAARPAVPQPSVSAAAALPSIPEQPSPALAQAAVSSPHASSVMRTPSAQWPATASAAAPPVAPSPRAACTGPIPLPMLQQQLQVCLPRSCPKAVATEFALEQLLTHGARQLDQAGDTHMHAAAARKVAARVAELLQQRVQAASGLLMRVGPTSVMARDAATNDPVTPLGTPFAAAQRSCAGTGAAAAPSSTSGGTPIPGLTPPPPLPGLAAGSPVAGVTVAGGRMATPDGSATRPLAEYDRLAPMVREMSQGRLLRANLSRQLQALAVEESAWQAVREETAQRAAARQQAREGDAQAASVGQPATQAQPAPEGCGSARRRRGSTAGEAAVSGEGGGEEAAIGTPTRGAAAEPAEPPLPAAPMGLLGETEAAVSAELRVQMEWLSGFLSKVEALVSLSEQACGLLQADYHEDMFRMFPHIDSPGWLIDQIVSKQAARDAAEGHGGAAAAGAPPPAGRDSGE